MSDRLFHALDQAATLCNDRLKTRFEQMARDEVYSGACGQYAKRLYDSMEYSLFAGGKRLRPFLVLEFCRLLGGGISQALSYACAIEMIHTYSLIHDDLPCMDDGELRRGKPANHIVFGEATSLLAGDSLLTDAFYMLCDNDLSDRQNLAALRLLSLSSGPLGMAAGQQIDLCCEGKQIPPEVLIGLQQKKTGALFCASCALGCIASGVEETAPEYSVAIEYARRIGLAFQITDDILDVMGEEKKLGKKKGGDAQRNKTTYVSLFTKDGAKKKAAEQVRLAKSALDRFSDKFRDRMLLYLLADYILERGN